MSSVRFPHPSEVLRQCFSLRECFSKETKARLHNKERVKTPKELVTAKQAHSISSLTERTNTARYKVLIRSLQKKHNNSVKKVSCNRTKIPEKATTQNGKHIKLLVTNHSLSQTTKYDIKEKLEGLKYRIKKALSNYAEREEMILKYSAKLKRENEKLKKLLLKQSA